MTSYNSKNDLELFRQKGAFEFFNLWTWRWEEHTPKEMICLFCQWHTVLLCLTDDEVQQFRDAFWEIFQGELNSLDDDAFQFVNPDGLILEVKVYETKLHIDYKSSL